MKSLALITAVFCAPLIASENPDNQVTPFSRIQESEETIQQLGAGVVQGSYKLLVYNGLVPLPLRYMFGPESQCAASLFGAFLPLSDAFNAIKLQCLHQALGNNSKEQNIEGFASREHAEQASSLPNRMSEVGNIIGSTATNSVIAYLLYKYWDKLPEADQKKLVVAGWAFGSLAWLTQDYGRNMRN